MAFLYAYYDFFFYSAVGRMRAKLPKTDGAAAPNRLPTVEISLVSMYNI